MAPPNDERRPCQGAGHVDAGSNNSASVPTAHAFEVDRRKRLVAEFGEDAAAYVEGCRRRRAAERRLQPLSDFTAVA